MAHPARFERATFGFGGEINIFCQNFEYYAIFNKNIYKSDIYKLFYCPFMLVFAVRCRYWSMNLGCTMGCTEI